MVDSYKAVRRLPAPAKAKRGADPEPRDIYLLTLRDKTEWVEDPHIDDLFLVIIDGDGYELLRPWVDEGWKTRWAWVCTSGTSKDNMKESAKQRALDIVTSRDNQHRYYARLDPMPKDIADSLRNL